MRVVQVMIRGRVQGVGYRAWCAEQAETLGLRGWVRNRINTDVEAIFAGEALVVAQMIDACSKGPRLARVNDVAVRDVIDAHEKDALISAGGRAGFRILETA